MISYELAIKIKDAGFPQTPQKGYEIAGFVHEPNSEYILIKEGACSPIVRATFTLWEEGIKRGDNLVKLPSLSELIEECIKLYVDATEGMVSVHFELTYTRVEKSTGCHATIGDEGYFRAEKPELIKDIEGFSETSKKEAVANLYIKLNEK